MICPLAFSVAFLNSRMKAPDSRRTIRSPCSEFSGGRGTAQGEETMTEYKKPIITEMRRKIRSSASAAAGNAINNMIAETCRASISSPRHGRAGAGDVEGGAANPAGRCHHRGSRRRFRCPTSVMRPRRNRSTRSWTTRRHAYVLRHGSMGAAPVRERAGDRGSGGGPGS